MPEFWDSTAANSKRSLVIVAFDECRAPSIGDARDICGRWRLWVELPENMKPVHRSAATQPVCFVVDLKDSRRGNGQFESSGEVSCACIDDHLVAQVIGLDRLAIPEKIRDVEVSITRLVKVNGAGTGPVDHSDRPVLMTRSVFVSLKKVRSAVLSEIRPGLMEIRSRPATLLR